MTTIMKKSILLIVALLGTMVWTGCQESYEIPAVEVVDLRMDSVILQMSKMTTTDYDFGGLDESFLPVL